MLGRFSAVPPCKLPVLLSELQLTCCWVTALAMIWPGSILAAPAGVGTAAASVLMLCCKYLDLVSRRLSINQRLKALYQQQDMQQQDMQQQQQQQLQLLQLPAADITAAVLHTASLLLADLGKHIADKTSPQDVTGLLLNAQALQQMALVVATLFGSQLQLNLLHEVQQQDTQPPQGSSNVASSGSSSGSNSGSGSSSCGSCGPPAVAAEWAEGVLLCRAQLLQAPQLLVPHPRISGPVVQSWLQRCEASWGELLPPHQLLRIAEAIAAVALVSAPQQHPNTMAVQESQGYKLLAPEHCLETAAGTAVTAADFAASSGGSSGGSSGRSSSGSGGSRGCSGGGSSSCGLVDTQLCVNYVQAAARVLGLGSADEQGSDHKHLPVCQLMNYSSGMHRVPVLLLSSAVAALQLKGAAALHAAWNCSIAAGALMDASWCDGTESRPCVMCDGLLRHLAWPTVGLLSLLLQQVTHAGDMVHFGLSRGSGAAATAATWLPQLIRFTATLLVRGLSRAVQKATRWMEPQQLQQVSMTVQVMEAAVRCNARLQQLLSQGESAAAAGDAGFRVEPCCLLLLTCAA
mgnify:CR=1 FL=1